MSNANETQVGGSHYKDLGDFHPWDVLKHWLTPEEYRGYQKGVAIAYLARERSKGGEQDIKKAAHHLQKLIEVIGEQAAAAVHYIGEDRRKAPRSTVEAFGLPPVGQSPYSGGWLPWNGKGRPVDLAAKVDIKLRNGEVHEQASASDLIWSHTEGDRNIMFYRLSPPAVPAT